MRRRLLWSGGPVVLVAAVVTTVALLLAGSSGKPRAAPRSAAGGISVVAATGTSRSYSYSSSQLPQPMTQAEMRQQGELVSQECGLGAGGRRAVGAPVAQTTLVSRHDRLSAYMYVIGHNEVICTQDNIAGDSVGGPQQAPAQPSNEGIAIAAVSAAKTHGRTATLEYGRAGTDVRHVSFVLAGGERVPAAVGGGWFLVWWPSSKSPTSAQLRTTWGRSTMSLGGEAASPATNCSPRTDCYSTSSPGRVIGRISPGSAGPGAGAGFSGTIVSAGASVQGALVPGPVSTSSGPRKTHHIRLTVTQVGSA